MAEARLPTLQTRTFAAESALVTPETMATARLGRPDGASAADFDVERGSFAPPPALVFATLRRVAMFVRTGAVRSVDPLVDAALYSVSRESGPTDRWPG